MTQKPLRLMRELVALFTNSGQTVLDPFMGSGTTGVACVELGRQFVGVEAKQQHFDTACRRIDRALRQKPLGLEVAAA